MKFKGSEGRFSNQLLRAGDTIDVSEADAAALIAGGSFESTASALSKKTPKKSKEAPTVSPFDFDDKE